MMMMIMMVLVDDTELQSVRSTTPTIHLTDVTVSPLAGATETVQTVLCLADARESYGR